MIGLELSRHALISCVGLALLAGCGGSQLGTVPSRAMTASVTSETAATACRVPDIWYFRGACVSHVLPPSGWTFNLSEYKGYTLTITIPANNGPGSDTFDVSDATGKGDITGKYFGAKFPRYGPECHSDGRIEKCPGKVFFYAHITGNNQQVIALNGVVTAQLESSDGFPRKTCFPAHIHLSTSDVSEWFPDQGLSEKPNGNSLSLNLATPNRYWGTRFHPNAHAVYAFVCR
jgi:hypothetical protein